MSLRFLVAAAAAAAALMAAGAEAAAPASTKHDADVIRFFQHHPRLAQTPAGTRALWRVMSHLEQTVRHLQAVRTAAVTAADMGAWNCIHGGEGAWDDAGSPFWGGLQMDYQFQKTYGSEFLARWGTADRWPRWAQLTAARRARDGYHGYPARHYSPWPNTARACGLL